ncbi:MAG: response regulator, partial [Elusimicrobiota bacterium]
PGSVPDVKIRLKPHPESEPKPAPEPEPEPEPPAEPAAPKKQRKARPFVLIVDSDYTLRESLTAFIEGKGVEWVTDSSNAQEAIIQAQSLSVEIVVMNLNMFKDLFKKLRESPFLDKEMSILVFGDASAKEAQEQLPADDPHIDYMPKPFENEVLWKVIVDLTGDTYK